jgi:hypothetical protein
MAAYLMHVFFPHSFLTFHVQNLGDAEANTVIEIDILVLSWNH